MLFLPIGVPLMAFWVLTPKGWPWPPKQPPRPEPDPNRHPANAQEAYDRIMEERGEAGEK